MLGVMAILSLCSVMNCVTIGKIENHVIIGAVIESSLFNLTRAQCLCEMMRSNELISAVNYFSINQTCQLFDYNLSLILITPNENSSLIFINQSSLAIANIRLYNTSTATTNIIETTTTVTTTSAARLPISNFASVTASSFSVAAAGSATAQADGLVDRVNSSGGTYFNSGGFPPQYVQLELPEEYNITYICLKVNQSPDGATEHRLYVGSYRSNMTLATNLSGVTSSGQWINTTYNPPLTRVRFIRLDSISSPSWVAWSKFIVYDYSPN